MNKPEKYKLLCNIDETKFLNFIEKNDIEFKKNEYNVMYNRDNGFDNCFSIFIVDDFKFNNEYLHIKDDFLKLLDSEVIDKIKKVYGKGKIFSLQLSNIFPEGKIRKHYDGGLNFILCHRIHVPLITNKNVIFGIGENEYFFENGQMFELNNLEYHYVSNTDSQIKRLHLIIDYCPDEYVFFLEQYASRRYKKTKIKFS